MPSLTIELNPRGELHKDILREVSDRVKFSKSRLSGLRDKWARSEEAALAYIPEKDIDAVRRTRREQSGIVDYTTIVVPYSYAILMASHTFWTTVFLGRNPIMQYAGRHGEGEQQVQAVEALIDYQMHVGEMLVPLYLWLMDVGKYGLGVVGTYWDERMEVISAIVEEPVPILGLIDPSRTRKVKRIQRIPGYHGNKLYNVRPYNFLWDPRVPAHRFQEGEYVAIYNEVSWNEYLRRHDRGLYTNKDRLEPGDRGSSSEREEGSAQLELPEDSDPSLGTQPSTNTDVVKVYECYIELVPSAWKLGKGDMPEKWVFTVTADFKTVIGAQPLGAVHNKFPFNVLEFEPEAYALVNRGIPEILDPIQRTVDWLINSHFYNVRKTLNDQFVVDPSRVVMKDVVDPLPGGIIRLAPSAYGQDPKTVISQLGVVDVTQGHLRDLQVMLGLGERTLGVSDQILGAVGQGGRKTATEVRAASSFGISRLKTVSEYFSAMGFAPLGQVLIQNSQQYYDMEQKFRIVGDLAQDAGMNFMQVTPDAIQGFFDYVPVDGTLPVDRFAQANLWRELLGGLRNFPEIMQQYDVGRIFSWVAQLAGLKNINQFKIQLGSPEQLMQQAAAGNVVPLGQQPAGTRPGPQSGEQLARTGEPGQVSGLGQTT